MKIVIANSVGIDENGFAMIHSPSRWTNSSRDHKIFTYYPWEHPAVHAKVTIDRRTPLATDAPIAIYVSYYIKKAACFLPLFFTLIFYYRPLVISSEVLLYYLPKDRRKIEGKRYFLLMLKDTIGVMIFKKNQVDDWVYFSFIPSEGQPYLDDDSSLLEYISIF